MSSAAEKLDARIRAHYTRESLGDDSLSRLRNSGAGESLAGESDGAETRRRGPGVAAAALVLAMLGVGLAAYGWVGIWKAGWEQQAHKAAAEIAYNHNKNLDVEFQAASFRDLQKPLARLDFQLAAPARMQAEGLRLIGARYCSVGGHIAAQIRLAGPEGRRLTLYQFRPGTDYEGLSEAGIESEIDGVRVVVWREAGLVMGLAR